MAGRYGRDQLNSFLYVVLLVLFVAGLFVRNARFANRLIFYLAVIVLVIIYYRTFSRNISRRSAENARFLQIRKALFGGSSVKKQMMQDKDHAYFKCPRCKKMLRVPKGKGKIKIHCPQCGTDFIENT